MQLFVRRPFHSAFGCGKLIDQLEQPIVCDQFRVRCERFLHIRIDIFLQGVRHGLEDEQIAQISDQIRHESHHVLAGFALLMKQINGGRRLTA